MDDSKKYRAFAEDGGLIFDLLGSYERAWQIGAVVGFAAGVIQILAGGPSSRHDQLSVPAIATT